MTFRVDDRFHSSGPVLRIPRRERLAVIGLWTLAGSWSRQFEKDGHVPSHMIEEFGGTSAQAARLVEVGLWRKNRRAGYTFVDWRRWQDTREGLEAKRAVWRERQARHRQKPADAGVGLAGVTGDTGDTPPLPSPSPSPSPSPVPRGDRDQSPGALTSEPPGDGPTVDNPPAKYSNVARAFEERTGEALGAIGVYLLVEHYAQRHPRQAPSHPDRYAITCIRNEDIEVLRNYAHTGRWSA